MILRGIRVFFAIILSIVLFLSSMAFIAVLTVQNSLRPDNIKSLLKSEAFSHALAESLFEDLEAEELPENFREDINKLIETVVEGPGFGAVLEEYVGTLTDYITTGAPIYLAVSESAKQHLVQDAAAAVEVMLGEYGIPDDFIENAKERFENDITEAINQLPQPGEMLQNVEIYRYYSWAAGYILSPAVIYGFGAFMLLVSCAIALLIFHRYRWMKYVAIPFLISGVLIVAAGVIMKFSVSVGGAIEQHILPLINSFIDSINKVFFISGGAYLLIVVVLFALAFIIKRSSFGRRAPV